MTSLEKQSQAQSFMLERKIKVTPMWKNQALIFKARRGMDVNLGAPLSRAR